MDAGGHGHRSIRQRAVALSFALLVGAGCTGSAPATEDALAPRDFAGGEGGLADAWLAADGAAGPDFASPPDGMSADLATRPDAAAGWRSALYPEAWTPAFSDGQGRFLHDFSYAGYHNGELALPALPPGKIWNPVIDQGADNQGKADATVAIQRSLDAASAAGGGIVLLPAGLYRLDGVLAVKGSRVVLRGEGAQKSRLYFTRDQGMTDSAHIVFSGALKQGADLPLASDGMNRARELLLGDASSLKVGDDVALGWVISDPFIQEHGMTGVWMAFNGKWQTFFRRRVVAVDLKAKPHRVTLDVPLRYPAKTRDLASLRVESGYLAECGIESLAIANAVDPAAAWKQLRVHAIDLLAVKDSWIRGVESFASPLPAAKGYHLQNGGLRVGWSKRVTVADSRLDKAQNRGGGGCGYLFEITMAGEVLIRDSRGANGRHNFIQNWGFGTSGCVFLRVESEGGRNLLGVNDPFGFPAYSEFHHSLATANLIDQSIARDGWQGGNRGSESSGAGHAVTESVYWNLRGGGLLASFAYGWGYVIGADMSVFTDVTLGPGKGTAPEDFVEGTGMAQSLVPQSLYEDQLRRRLGR